jgi:hypothetical protein
MLGSGKAPALPDWTKSFSIYQTCDKEKGE